MNEIHNPFTEDQPNLKERIQKLKDYNSELIANIKGGVSPDEIKVRVLSTEFWAAIEIIKELENKLKEVDGIINFN